MDIPKYAIAIDLENGQQLVLEEKHLNCNELTVRGHASKLVASWGEHKDKAVILKLDSYNAVEASKIVAIRVVHV
jgi:hypothetical protein